MPKNIYKNENKFLIYSVIPLNDIIMCLIRLLSILKHIKFIRKTNLGIKINQNILGRKAKLKTSECYRWSLEISVNWSIILWVLYI